MPRKHHDGSAQAQRLGPSADPSEEVQSRGDLTEAGKVMFYQEGAVITEGLGFYVAFDEFSESCSTVIISPSPSCLVSTEKSKLHCFSSNISRYWVLTGAFPRYFCQGLFKEASSPREWLSYPFVGRFPDGTGRR